MYDVLKMPISPPPGFTEDIFTQRIIIKKLEGGGFLAESENYPNLYATGGNLDELRDAFYDTVLTYFDVPRYYAKRRIDNFHLNLDDGTVIRAKTASNNEYMPA